MPRGKRIENAPADVKRKPGRPRTRTVTIPVATIPPGLAEKLSERWLKPGEGLITARLPNGAEVEIAGPGILPNQVKVSGPKGTVFTWVIVT